MNRNLMQEKFDQARCKRAQKQARFDVAINPSKRQVMAADINRQVYNVKSELSAIVTRASAIPKARKGDQPRHGYEKPWANIVKEWEAKLSELHTLKATLEVLDPAPREGRL